MPHRTQSFPSCEIQLKKTAFFVLHSGKEGAREACWKLCAEVISIFWNSPATTAGVFALITVVEIRLDGYRADALCLSIFAAWFSAAFKILPAVQSICHCLSPPGMGPLIVSVLPNNDSGSWLKLKKMKHSILRLHGVNRSKNRFLTRNWSKKNRHNQIFCLFEFLTCFLGVIYGFLKNVRNILNYWF